MLETVAFLPHRAVDVRFGGDPNLAGRDERAEAGEEAGDIRTMAVQVDERGTNRHMEWRQVCRESSQQHFRDLPPSLRGEPQAMNFCQIALQIGGSPGGYFRELTKEMHLTKADKLWHDLKALIDIIEIGGNLDQLNMGGNACLESAIRRFQALVEANKTSGGPNWNVAKHIASDLDPTDTLTTGFRSDVQRKAREALETANFQSRMKTLGRVPELLEESGALGGLPSASDRAADRSPAYGANATTGAAAKRRARKLKAEGGRAGEEG